MTKKKMNWKCGCGREFPTKKECEGHVKTVHGEQIRSTAGLASLRYHCKQITDVEVAIKTPKFEEVFMTGSTDPILAPPIKPKTPKGMALQKSLTKSGGQMHFKNGGGKKKPKTLSAKKTNKRVKKGSDNLMTFGVKLPDVRTLGDMMG